MDETSGAALALKTGVPSYQVEDEEGRTHLLIHLPIGRSEIPQKYVNAASKAENDPPRSGPDPGNKLDPADHLSESRCTV
jgi:hypothetical protein